MIIIHNYLDYDCNGVLTWFVTIGSEDDIIPLFEKTYLWYMNKLIDKNK